MRNTMIKKLLLNQGKYETVEGVPPLTLERSLGRNLKDYKLYGNSIQDGTPTPDTPVEVESVGEYDEATGKYKIPIVTQGKNLFDINNTEHWKQSGYKYYSIYVGANQTITASWDNDLTSGQGFYLCVGTKSSEKGNGNAGGGNWLYNSASSTLCHKVVKAKADAEGYIYINMSPLKYDKIQKLQIEYGSAATEFEPYKESITTNIYLPEPLRKVGDYSDYIDFANGKVVRNIKRVDLKRVYNTYTWVDKLGVQLGNILDNNYSRNANSMSNRESIFVSNAQASHSMWVGANNNYVYWIGILDYLGFTTVDEFNAWLAENPTYICYTTKNPTEELIELPQLPTFKGTTVYTVDTIIQPSNMEVTYKRR